MLTALFDVVGLRRITRGGHCLPGKNRDHPDTESEHVLHLGSGNLAGLLEETEKRRQVPRSGIHDRH